MAKSQAKAPVQTIHLTKYPKMVQRYFVPLDDEEGEPNLTEVFKVNSKAEPAKDAQTFDIITSTGKTHIFATEVNEVIKMTQADKNRELAKLKADFVAGKIDHKKYADKITQLI